MKIKVLVAVITLTSIAWVGANANLESLGWDFAAPVVSSESDGRNQVGQIIYDASSASFKGRNTSGSWLALSEVTGATAVTGDISISVATSKSGWIICDGSKSIGDIGSSASLEGDTYKALYDLIWALPGLSTTAGHPFQISSAKGASAQADWDAGKTITIDFGTNELFIRQDNSSLTLGGYQADAFQGHEHTSWIMNNNSSGGGSGMHWDATNTLTLNTNGIVTDGTNGTPRIANETRPKNVALNYFIKY